MKCGAWTRIERPYRGFFLLVALLATSVLADETRLIQLKHRRAAEIIPLIQPLLGPSDTVTGTDYRLIVRTSARNLRDIEQLLSQLDTTRRQLRITVKHSLTSDLGATKVGLTGEAGSDNAGIRLPRYKSEDYDSVNQRNGLRFETQQMRTTSSGETNQFVSALEGAPAFVRVGQSYPHVQHILALTGKQQLVLAQGVSLNSIVTGFDVIPHTQGQNILLQITPRLSSVQNPSVALVSFHEHSTTLLVQPGEWTDIAATINTNNEIYRAILDSSDSRGAKRHTLLLKVE